MPTAKKRINLTVEDDLFASLQKLAKQENASVASVSHALIERALELKEDLYFSKIGDERLQSKSKRLTHEEIWD